MRCFRYLFVTRSVIQKKHTNPLLYLDKYTMQYSQMLGRMNHIISFATLNCGSTDEHVHIVCTLSKGEKKLKAST